MSRLSVFAAAAVLSALATTAVAFAKEHHHTHNRLSHVYAIPGWSYAAPRPTVHHDDTPSYDDPSKYGGDAALPVK